MCGRSLFSECSGNEGKLRKVRKAEKEAPTFAGALILALYALDLTPIKSGEEHQASYGVKHNRRKPKMQLNNIQSKVYDVFPLKHLKPISYA
jgi:hypothetical protein